MTEMELMADVCKRSLALMKMLVEDFSDADMLARPCTGANHAAWQLGHLIASEAFMVNACSPGAVGELPAGFAEKYTTQTAGIDDKGAFGTKEELFSLATAVREATLKWIMSLTPKAMAEPAPGQLRDYAPTVGHLALLVPQHSAMHLGQMQVIRRKLGKAVLF